MHIPVPLLLLLLPLASAVFTKLQPGYSPNGGLLAARAGCTIHSTCDECFGDGYVICAIRYCFAPGKGHQCCRDGSYCIAASDSCCDVVGGAGATGEPGDRIFVSSATVASSLTVTEHGEGSVITCMPSNKQLDYDGLACCKLYNTTWSFCPNSTGCYAVGVQRCCTDGSICQGEGCCGLVGAQETTPFPLGAQQTSAADAGTSGSMTTAGAGGQTVTQGAEGTGVSTSTPTGAAVTNALGGAMVVAMGVLGVAML